MKQRAVKKSVVDDIMAIAKALDGLYNRSYALLKPTVDDVCQHPENVTDRNGDAYPEWIDRSGEFVTEYRPRNVAGNVTEKDAENNSLKSAGRIRRVGPDKGGHWEVC